MASDRWSDKVFRKKPVYYLLCVGIIIISFTLPQQVLAQTPELLVYPFFGDERATSQGYSSSHPALDWYSPFERLISSGSGHVVEVNWWNDECHQYWDDTEPYEDHENCAYGLYIRIDHGNNYRSLYAHMSATAYDLGNPNVYVYQREVVGTSGHNGFSSASHLHFQFQENVSGVWSNRNPHNYWVSDPETPAPPEGAQRLIDDGATGFTTTGYFPLYTGAGLYGDMRWTDVWSSITGTATWAPNLPEAGIYDVYVYIPDERATTWQAIYTINHASGTSTARVDQQGVFNRWISIGAYLFGPGSSGSVSTNDFTGEGYRIHCYNADGISPPGENRCKVGADAVKFVRRDEPVFYFPDLRDRDGWESEIHYQNGGDDPIVSLRTSVFDSNGSLVCLGSWALPAHAATYASFGECGSAIRSGFVAASGPGSDDLAVAVMQHHENPDAVAAYTGVEDATMGVYVPLVQKNNYDIDSQLFIQHTGDFNTIPRVYFRPAPGFDGKAHTETLATLHPGDQVLVDLDAIEEIGEGVNNTFIGSVYIASGEPLAVAWTMHIGNFQLQESSSAGGVARKVYAPLIQNYNWNWISGVSAQTSYAQTVTVNYYPQKQVGGQYVPCHTKQYSGLGAQYPAVYPFPPGTTCNVVASAIIEGASYNTAGVVSQITPGTVLVTDYPAISDPGTTVLLPVLMKQWNSRNSGFVIQNTTGYATSVTVKYYHSDGTQACVSTPQVFSITKLGDIKDEYPLPSCLPNGFYGSAVITSNRKVAVVVNHVIPNDGDNMTSHIGLHR